VTERGAPFVKESFGNWFMKACVRAKVPGSARGLRKAGATRAAENGATERELMALFGWTSGKMATHYTRSEPKAPGAGGCQPAPAETDDEQIGPHQASQCGRQH